jgi:hypothetical protein
MSDYVGLCLSTEARLKGMGFEIADEDPEDDQVFAAFNKVTFIKNEDVPLVRVHRFVGDADSGEQQPFVGISVEISYGISTFLVTLYRHYDSLMNAKRAKNIIALAAQYAQSKNYRLQIDIKPEDYE